jgi:hypothetical protein
VPKNKSNLNRVRVLAAMLTLREFTAADLAAFSEVKLGTVRSILQRDHHLLELVGQVRGRRGGVSLRHKLSKKGESQVTKEVQQIRAPESRSPSRSYIAAADALTRKLSSARNDDERRLAVELAKTAVAALARKKLGGEEAIMLAVLRKLLDHEERALRAHSRRAPAATHELLSSDGMEATLRSSVLGLQQWR